MDIFLAVLAGVLLLLGFIGTFLPVLPGPVLAWAGLLAAHFSSYSEIKIWILVAAGILTAFVSIMDNIFPSMLTKKSGGSKAGVLGSTIGLFAGFFLGPLFVILGPFLGAFIGEMIHDSSDAKKAFKAAWGAFKGFLLGTGIKMISVLIFIWIFAWSVFAGK
ncbi:MAG: DUF456 domain-containing protein [Treponema sp.]|nr:DUF456 domain-containing protein [Treponema sp.]